ncbi:hypothetical protein K440DRAFT_247486 [Wilcoxina mikolae CBS 423.85]|nr:hypothetical protein K440DRAFT_247486 [Wilcoxina mikolae CBS 423.85]
MEQKNYEQAVICFIRAGDKIGQALASAYHAQVIGREYRAAGKKNKSVEAFEKACRLFLNAGRVEKAAQCQHDIGNILAAAEILSAHGRHKEAAWDFMEAGFPKKAAREYGETLDHEKVLAMCYYAGLYNELIVYMKCPPSEINRSCRKLYARLCYLLMSQKKCGLQFEGTIRSYLGSSEEQETAAREFGMVNHVIQLQTAGGRFQEACELAVNVGLLEEALSLVNDRGALLPEPVLSTVVDYVHAGRLIHISTKLEGSKQKEEANKAEKNYSTYEGGRTFLLDQTWMSLMASLNRYIQSGEIPSTEDYPKGFLREFFILLAAKITPGIQSDSSNDLNNVPLEIMGEAVGILKILSESSWEPIQHSVLLFLGIYTPQTSVKSIAMPWSPPSILPKRDFPIQYFTQDARDTGIQVILEVIYTTLGSIEQLCRKKWQGKTSKLPGCGNVQWTSNFYSGHSHKTLLSVNVILAKLTACLSKRRNINPPILQCKFWPRALIEHLSFISSFQQDATVTTLLAKEITTRSDSEYQGVRNLLQQTLIYSISEINFNQEMLTFTILSTLFKQMQSARLLGVNTEWYEAMQARVHYSPRLLTLTNAFEVITLFRALYTNTTEDLPVAFSENICKLISKLEQVQSTFESHRLFHSASLLIAYEELITLMLLLARPAFFVIPRSWASLHMPICAKIPRFTSVWEVFGIKSLQAESFHNVQAGGLLQVLKDDFAASYHGKDNIRVIVTDGCIAPESIAELPVPRSAIIYPNILKPRERLEAPEEPNLRIAQLNAAYTHFFGMLWHTRQIPTGPEVL